MGHIAMPLFATALGGFIWWVCWVAAHPSNRWTSKNMVRIAKKAGCEPADDADDGDYSDCLEAFLVWVSPMAVALATFLFGLMVHNPDSPWSPDFTPFTSVIASPCER